MCFLYPGHVREVQIPPKKCGEMFKYYDMFKANCKHTLVNSDKHRDTVILEYPYKIRRYRRTLRQELSFLYFEPVCNFLQ